MKKGTKPNKDHQNLLKTEEINHEWIILVENSSRKQENNNFIVFFDPNEFIKKCCLEQILFSLL